MQGRVSIPLIDLVFLSLGAIVAILSQTQLIRALPVEVTEVERGIAAIARDRMAVVTISRDGLFADGEPVGLDELVGVVDGRLALLRVDRRVPAETLVRVMSVLAAGEVELRIEVHEHELGHDEHGGT